MVDDSFFAWINGYIPESTILPRRALAARGRDMMIVKSNADGLARGRQHVWIRVWRLLQTRRRR